MAESNEREPIASSDHRDEAPRDESFWRQVGTVAGPVAKQVLKELDFDGLIKQRVDVNAEKFKLELQAEKDRAANELQKQLQEQKEKYENEKLDLQRQSLDRRAKRLSMSLMARTVVLGAVVFAVLIFPAWAMYKRFDPAEFTQYIAPITGITGAIIGYWFGQAAGAESGAAGSRTQDNNTTSSEN